MEVILQGRGLDYQTERLVNLREDDGVIGEPNLGHGFRPFLGPKVGCFTQAVNCLMHKPHMIWGHELQLVKDRGWLQNNHSTLR